MNQSLTGLLAASIAFVGSHFAMSHPLRAPMVRTLGDKGFQAVYSLVSLAAFGWMVMAFRAIPAAGFAKSGALGWGVASLLTFIALVLLAGSFRGNPALPQPGAEKLALQEPAGVFRVTRHPMMWAIAFWAIAHIILFWNQRTLMVAGAMLVLALAGAHLQDRKKEQLMGASWQQWEAKTSFLPRLGQLSEAGLLPWLVGLLGWLAITWAHGPLGGVRAGIWLGL